jgi:hypothetical protein
MSEIPASSYCEKEIAKFWPQRFELRRSKCYYNVDHRSLRGGRWKSLYSIRLSRDISRLQRNYLEILKQVILRRVHGSRLHVKLFYCLVDGHADTLSERARVVVTVYTYIYKVFSSSLDTVSCYPEWVFLASLSPCRQIPGTHDEFLPKTNFHFYHPTVRRNIF